MSGFYLTMLTVSVVNSGEDILRMMAKQTPWPPPGARIASDLHETNFPPLSYQPYRSPNTPFTEPPR